MKFWPFPLSLNHETTRALSELFLRFAACDDLEVTKTEPHYIELACKLGTLRFWNSNRYYAWAQDGEYRKPSGRIVNWWGQMPSRYAMKQMRLAIGRAGFKPFDPFEDEAESANVVALVKKESA